MIVIQVMALYLLYLQFLLITDWKMEQEMDRQCGVAATVSDHSKELSIYAYIYYVSVSDIQSRALCSE